MENSDATLTANTISDNTANEGGGLLLSFFIPSRQAEAAGIAPQPWTASAASGAEVNAWLMIGSGRSGKSSRRSMNNVGRNKAGSYSLNLPIFKEISRLYRRVSMN